MTLLASPVYVDRHNFSLGSVQQMSNTFLFPIMLSPDLQLQAAELAEVSPFRVLQVVFATAVTKPGHGNIAPLAIGFTLFASAFVGEAQLFQPQHAHSPASSDYAQDVALQ